MLALEVDSGDAKPHRAGAIPAPRVESEGGFLLREKAPPYPQRNRFVPVHSKSSLR